MKTHGLRILTAASLLLAIANGNTSWDRRGIDWELKAGKNRKRAHCVNSGVLAAKRAKTKRRNIAKKRGSK